MNVPMILSAASLITLEDVRAVEIRTPGTRPISAAMAARIEPLVDRVAAAGYDTFVVTADVPVPANRENNIRNGFLVPLAITPRVAFDSNATASVAGSSAPGGCARSCSTACRTWREHGRHAWPAGPLEEPRSATSAYALTSSPGSTSS